MTQIDRRSFLKQTGLAALGSGTGILLPGTWTGCAGEGALNPTALADLRAGMGGAVLVPGSPEYQARRGDYNRRIDATPEIIALCASPHDVAHCVRWARHQGVPISMRSGGHSYEGFSLGPGIVIDVSAMNAVKVDAPNGTAVIGAGARLGQVYGELWKHGLTLPAGACPSVGIAGLTLGGGYGLLSRKWGLTSDNLLSLGMIDASGKVLAVSPEQHPDLFWACRGAGGGHFGIVTAFTFKLHPIQNVAMFELKWPIGQVKAAFRAWQEWAPSVDDNLTCEFVIPASVGFCKSVGQFVGTEAQLRRILAPLLHTGTPTVKTWTSSFTDAVKYVAGPDDPKPVFLKGKSDYALRPIGPEAVDTIVSHLSRLTGAASAWIQFDNYGGAINRIPAAASAFPHRAGTLYSVQYNALWNKPETTAGTMQWIRAFYASMRPYFSGYSYVNYCDLDLPNWQSAYYGANFARLTRVKSAYDPGNIFHFAQSIPPA